MSLEVNGRPGLLQRLSIIKKVVWGNARNKGSRAAIVVKTRVSRFTTDWLIHFSNYN